MNNSKYLLLNTFRFVFFFLSTSFFILSATQVVSAAAGDLDRSFGNNGTVKIPFPIISSEMAGSILQSDGKFITVGSVFQSGSNQDFYILRFNSNGSLDSTFGTNGRVLVAVSTREDSAYGVALQPDGKIITVGTSRNISANYDFAVVRLNENGTLDSTFGNNGVVITSTSNTDDYAQDAIVQSDNKIVVCGKGTGNNGMTFTVVRYNAEGSLDNSFDGDGIAKTQFPTGLSEALKVKLQADGKIVAAGAAAFGDFTNTAFGFARYNTDGSLDTSFGDNGTVVADVRTGAARQNVANDLLIQPDGKIVAVGYSNSGLITAIDFALARLNSDGSLDSSFGNGGKIVTPIQGSNNDFAKAVVLQTDGKLIVGGTGKIGNDPDFTVIRYNPNGTLDTQFGNNGIVVTRLAGNGEGISKLRVEASGKIFAAGFSNFEATFALYQTNGSREIDFDGDKKTDISIFRPSVGEWWYSRSSDGQVPAVQFGQSADKIMPADFTGDGKTDIAFWRPSDGFWFVLRSEDSSYFSFPFGQTGDIPIVGDFDADGKADPGVFRPSNSTWFISLTSGGTSIIQFGTTGDAPVVADYDGDGKTDIAVFRPSTGEWFILRSEDLSYFSFPFGASGDIPAPGDYDGDGKTDAAVFRSSTATWYINRTTAGILITNFGASGDIPVPSVFIP